VAELDRMKGVKKICSMKFWRPGAAFFALTSLAMLLARTKAQKIIDG
jgi:hypothetical protein